MSETRPRCYSCIHRRDITGNAHSRCNNVNARTKGNIHGIAKGWFRWPYNFDPVWLEECDGYSANPKDALPLHQGSAIEELLAGLK